MLTHTGEKTPNWKREYNQHKQDHEEAKKRLNNVKINSLENGLSVKTKRLQGVQQNLNKTLADTERKKTLLLKRQEILNNTEREQARITTKRREEAKRMTQILNNNVIISIGKQKNKSEFQKWIKTTIRSKALRSHHYEAIVDTFNPRELAKILHASDGSRLANEAKISPNATGAVINYFSQNPNLIYELEEVVLEDFPDIRMQLINNEYSKLNDLSTGQKFTVIILLSLVDDHKPLIYDQPEDALEATLIYSNIAQLLRKAKDMRQFIFATHNPNISVAADIDLAIVLKATATEAEVDEVGGIEEGNIKTLLIDYLEGGTEAITQRIRKLELKTD